MRTTIYSIVLFLLAFVISAVVFIPVTVLVAQVQPYLPDEVILQSPQGNLLKGSVNVSTKQFNVSLPVDWQACVINWAHPIGVCLKLIIQDIEARLAVQPWMFGETLSIYNASANTEISKLATLHPALGLISAMQGKVIVDLSHLQFDVVNSKIKKIEGQLQLLDASALGLKLGNVNTSLNSEISANDTNNIVIAVEGGTLDQIKTQGSGIIDDQGQFSIRFLFRSNNKAIQNQLSAVVKRISDTEFEFNYATKLF